MLSDEHDKKLIEESENGSNEAPITDEERDFVSMVIENLKISGVQQMDKNNKVTFSSLGFLARKVYFSGWKV